MLLVYIVVWMWDEPHPDTLAQGTHPPSASCALQIFCRLQILAGNNRPFTIAIAFIMSKNPRSARHDPFDGQRVGLHERLAGTLQTKTIL
mgnify:CR=1